MTDMWRPYPDIADKFLPGRLIVVDRFHGVRMANRGYDNVRKIVGRSLAPWVAGSQLLLSLLKDDVFIAKAIRAKNYTGLHGAALIAREGVPCEMSMSDPALFRGLRDATTLFFLKGYACLNVDKIAALASATSKEADPV